MIWRIYNIKRSFISRKLEREKFTKWEWFERKCFSFYVSNPPSTKVGVNPAEVGNSDYLRNCSRKCFKTCGCTCWVAPICLLTSALRVFDTGPTKWIWSFCCTSFEMRSFESMKNKSFSMSLHRMNYMEFCISCIHVKCFVRFTCCTYWALYLT